MDLSRAKMRLLVVCYLVFGVCTTASAAESINAGELVDRMNNGDAPFILDVRTPEEYAASHIPGAVNIPLMSLVSQGAQLRPYRDKEIVVYCQVGPRAAFAKYLMKQNGFTGVRDLQGHMEQWLTEGRPVEKQQ